MDAITLVHGGVSVLDRDDVDTDQIIPKQFLKRVERTGFGEFLFYDWAKQPGWELPANPILATGRNFGCGSSREHAPWALEDYGFQAIIAPSSSSVPVKPLPCFLPLSSPSLRRNLASLPASSLAAVLVRSGPATFSDLTVRSIPADETE